MLTVAVNVTTWPLTEGLADEVTTVVVDALLTTWLMDAETGLALKLPLPLVNAAVMVWLAVLSVLVAKAAVSEAVPLSMPVPMATPLS